MPASREKTPINRGRQPASKATMKTGVSRRAASEMEDIVVTPGTGHPVTTENSEAVLSPRTSARLKTPTATTTSRKEKPARARSSSQDTSYLEDEDGDKSVNSPSSSESEERRGRKYRVRHRHEQLYRESSASSHTSTSEGSKERSRRSQQTMPRGEFNQLKAMVDTQLLHMKAEMSDMTARSAGLVADELRQILRVEFEAFRQQMLQEIRIEVNKLQTSESEKAKQTVQQPKMKRCYNCGQARHFARRCKTQQPQSETSGKSTSITAVSASTDRVREAAAALDGSSGGSSGRLAGSEVPDQPQKEEDHPQRRRSNYRKPRHISNEDVIPVQGKIGEWHDWQQRDPDILPILIVVKKNKALSKAEIEKLSESSKRLYEDIDRLILIDEILCRIWYTGSERNKYQIVTPYQARERLLQMAHKCNTATTSSYAAKQLMIDRIQPNYYWPYLLTDVKRFHKNCQTCQHDSESTSDDQTSQRNPKGYYQQESFEVGQLVLCKDLNARRRGWTGPYQVKRKVSATMYNVGSSGNQQLYFIPAIRLKPYFSRASNVVEKESEAPLEGETIVKLVSSSSECVINKVRASSPPVKQEVPGD